MPELLSYCSMSHFFISMVGVVTKEEVEAVASVSLGDEREGLEFCITLKQNRILVVQEKIRAYHLGLVHDA